MKSTKNLLMTGVVLAIALFASVQVTAMAPAGGVNHNLNPEDASFLTMLMEEYAKDQENVRLPMWVRTRAGEKLARVKNIYYGNKPYTNADRNVISYDFAN